MPKTHTRRGGGPRRGGAVGPLVAGLFLAALGLRAAPALAQVPLVCGAPQLHTLEPDGVDTYNLSIPDGATAVLQGTSLSDSLGKVRLQLSGPGGPTIDTCSGIIGPELRNRSGDFTLQVSQCNGSSGGDYTVTMNITSGGDANCGRELDCGSTPAGVGFAVPGAVDSFRMQFDGGERNVRLKMNYLEPPEGNESGAPYLQLFDENGNKVVQGTCSETIDLAGPLAGGTYTALVSPCIGTRLRNYRLELYRTSACASGPTITHFGITNAQNEPVKPSGYDESGRPIFVQQLGYGLHVVVEARAGANTKRPGDYTVPHDSGGTTVDGDLQVILSAALGDGNPAICDINPPDFVGGVPAAVPFDFDDNRDAVEDMGCRFDNGLGQHVGRRAPIDACTVTGQLFGESFVDRLSTIQYCTGIIDTAWAFADGDTIVGARVKDIRGAFGEAREIVVRISGVITPTPTDIPDSPTPTFTDTPTFEPVLTATPTPDGGTPTPLGPCVADCNGDGTVAINELITALLVALGNDTLALCPSADADGDGVVVINDLVQAVNSSLIGCSP